MKILPQPAFRWGILALASGGFLSYLPVQWLPHRRLTGAGLVGSLWGVAALQALPIDKTRGILVWIGAVALSLVISDLAEAFLQKKDDARIVIDEFVGYWTAILFLPRSAPAVIMAFILFRLFDSWKPLGIRRCGNLPGGWGIVLDDLAAGLAANVLLQIVNFIHPL